MAIICFSDNVEIVVNCCMSMSASIFSLGTLTPFRLPLPQWQPLKLCPYLSRGSEPHPCPFPSHTRQNKAQTKSILLLSTWKHFLYVCICLQPTIQLKCFFNGQVGNRIKKLFCYSCQLI